MVVFEFSLVYLLSPAAPDADQFSAADNRTMEERAAESKNSRKE
jgi:hypothetical protein